MTWRIIGIPIDTADAAPSVPTIYQTFTLDSDEGNKLLRHAIAGIIAHNPTFTAITMKIWADSAGSPSKLIATSTNSKVRSDLLAGAQNYGVCWAKFTFNDLPLKAGATYHLSLNVTGYTYGASTHLAWRKSYPDPQYRTGLTLNAAKGAKHPLELVLITADL